MVTVRPGQRFAMAGFACVFGLLISAAVVEHEYREYASVPRELALVVRQVDGTHHVRCGKEKPLEQITTFAVAQPRPLFPSEFTVAGCGLEVGPDDYVYIARKDTSARPEVSVAPLDTQRQVVGTVALVGAAFFAGTYLLLSLKQIALFLLDLLTDGRVLLGRAVSGSGGSRSSRRPGR